MVISDQKTTVTCTLADTSYELLLFKENGTARSVVQYVHVHSRLARFEMFGCPYLHGVNSANLHVVCKIHLTHNM